MSFKGWTGHLLWDGEAADGLVLWQRPWYLDQAGLPLHLQPGYMVCVCVLLFIFCVQKADIRSPKMFFFLFVCVRYNDVLQRCKELDSWTQDLSLPSVVWLSGLFNPQSFLTGNTHSCMQPTKKSFKILIIYLLHHHSSTLTLQRWCSLWHVRTSGPWIKWTWRWMWPRSLRKSSTNPPGRVHTYTDFTWKVDKHCSFVVG